MNSDSLKKPVDLQGLSLALAKTKTDYMAMNQQLGDGMEQYIKDYVSSNAGDKTWYGYCTTDTAYQDKIVNIDGFTSDKLVAGVKVVIGFRDGNGADSPRLNVSSTGAKPIITSGIGINSSQVVGIKRAERYEWSAGIITFVYDGYGQWIMESQQHATTSYFGVTKLSNVISNDSTTALTPLAVYNNVLTKTNTTSYTPTEDYHPATKQYVDSSAGVYCVTATKFESPSGTISYSTDKTFDDTYRAYSSGQTVILKVKSGSFDYTLYILSQASVESTSVGNRTLIFSNIWNTTSIHICTWEEADGKYVTFDSTYLSNYQTKLTFDSAPTENSTNPVTSGGVYTALQSAGTTYSLSLSGSTITLTGSDGSTSSINLPIYDGSVTEVWTGGTY